MNFDKAVERKSTNGTAVLEVKGIAPITDLTSVGVVIAVPKKMIDQFTFKIICEPKYEVY